jgi:hypothetical protein
LIGKALIWVKGRLRHGQFGPWVESNLWFSQRTAQRFQGFALECDRASSLLEYQPGKNDMVTDLEVFEKPKPVVSPSVRAMRLTMALEWVAQWDRESDQMGCEAKFQQLMDRMDSILARLKATRTRRGKAAGDQMEIARELGRRIRESSQILDDVLLHEFEFVFQVAKFRRGLHRDVRKLFRHTWIYRLPDDMRPVYIAQSFADFDEDLFNWEKYGLGEAEEQQAATPG